VLLVCLVVAAVAGDASRVGSAEEPRIVDRKVAQDLFDTLNADLAKQVATHERGGRWRSADSSILAWSCGQQLSALVDLFEATRQRKWLDQLVRYADANCCDCWARS